jgi:hypothetical protein
MMSREYLPFTTDVVFGKVGHEVTFSQQFLHRTQITLIGMRTRPEKMMQIMGVMVDRQKTLENTSSSSNAPKLEVDPCQCNWQL